MIKLHTTLGDEPKLTILYEWPRNVPKLLHDAAVAHAYQEALDKLLFVSSTRSALIEEIQNYAAKLLKEWGVENG